MAGPGFAGSMTAKFTDLSRRVFGENLTGVYLHGSAAMGCFHPAKSDLDLIVVVRGSPDDDRKRAYMDGVAALDAEMGGNAAHGGIEMSVVTESACKPFVYPTPFELHYSRMHTGWYRRDPAGYVREMKGTDKDLAAHFTVILRRGLCLYGRPAETVFGEVPEADYLDAVLEDVADARERITEEPLYLILNLARVLAYEAEGAVLSKKEGGEWGLANLPEAFHPLVRAALEDYAADTRAEYDPEQARAYADYMLEKITEYGGIQNENTVH